MKKKSPIAMFVVLVACVAAMAFASTSSAGQLVSVNSCYNMATNSVCNTGSSNVIVQLYSRMSLVDAGYGVNKCAAVGRYPSPYFGMRCDNATYTYSACGNNSQKNVFGINKSPNRRNMKIAFYQYC